MSEPTINDWYTNAEGGWDSTIDYENDDMASDSNWDDAASFGDWAE
jgi:hypothetical protein